MKGAEFIPVKREWLLRAFHSPNPNEAVGKWLDIIFKYAFDEIKPDLRGGDLKYFNSEIAPEIDYYRAEWRLWEIRQAQFYEVIKELPDKCKQRFEVDFLRLSFKDHEDFLNYLEELTEEVKKLPKQ